MSKSSLLILVAFVAALSAGATSPGLADSGRQVVTTGALGKGTVTLWQQSGQLGVTLDKAALDSLPKTGTRVDLVSDVAPFRLVEIDWNPQGHEPKGVYDVPHFDAHFYVIDKAERDSIAFAAPGKATRPDAGAVPEGYISDGTVIPQMGMHYISATRPEFHGKPFTCTQIWGYNNGHLAFVEAMFTQKFMTDKGTFTEAIPRPAKLADANSLPKTMNVAANPAGGYDITLTP